MALTPLTKKRVLYSDFGRSMDRHPFTDDLVRKTNEEAVKESIRNLVLTNKLERPFQPSLGCDVRKLLFENYGPQTSLLVEKTIRSTIAQYESRVELIKIDITPVAKNLLQQETSILITNEFRISIHFRVINSTNTSELELILSRIR